MSADDTPPTTDPDDPDGPLGFTTAEKALAGLLLLGIMGLAYVCLDVMSNGRITQTLARSSA